MNVQVLNDRILLADQPTADELETLAGQGVRAVVNLRNSGEPDQPLSPPAEGAVVHAAGLDYLHVPVGAAPLSDADVEAVHAFIDAHTAGDGKILLHCRKGPRAVALAILYRARAEGWTPAETLDRAAAEGLTLQGPPRLLVEQYLASK